MRRIHFFMLFAACSAGTGISAQTAGRGYVSIGLSSQSWDVEDADPVRQTVFPLAVYVPFSNRLHLHFSNTPGSTASGGMSLSGLSDTWLKATYVFSGDRFMINAGIGAPTGKTSLNPSEFTLSQMLSENIFQFRLPVYGQGLSVKIGAALALPLNDRMVFGFGVNAVTKQAYHPVEDGDIEFQPGNETSVFAGFDSKPGLRSKWTVDLVYTLYGTDRINDVNVYNSGAKLLVHSTLAFGLGSGTVTASLNFRQKGKNEYWVGTVSEPETKNSNGNQLEIDLDWRIVQGRTAGLSLLGTGRSYAKNQYGERGGHVFGGGAGTAVRLSSKTSWFLHGKYLSGTFEPLDRIRLKGWDAASGVTFEL